MKLHEINDPALRRRAVEIELQVSRAKRKQAEDLVKALTEQEIEGRCFGSHDEGDIRCRRCWLEFPCKKLEIRFQEWSKDDEAKDPEAKDSEADEAKDPEASEAKDEGAEDAGAEDGD